VTEGNLRPFARDRAGMKLGEGYGIVILERATIFTVAGARHWRTLPASANQPMRTI